MLREGNAKEPSTFSIDTAYTHPSRQVANQCRKLVTCSLVAWCGHHAICFTESIGGDARSMALWDALAPAGAVAQLVGTDAAGLVSATLQAVRTARRNRKECHTLARRVMTVGDLLQLVVQHGSSSETMRRPEVRKALEGLDGALRRAYELVESCQERGAVYGFVMAGR
ncbi:hypothetical protein SETIT_6G118000v2 [Setaria italica]|uniref:MCAfunc domain-containing protein n=1 Tax=Setaria italica TaxID=4555 RepID=A0A368RKR7_SETIT|nr:hypothetical protein SETIT_6G118000v2 [Setaria italica]